MAKISFVFLLILVGSRAIAAPSCEDMAGQMIITNPPPEPSPKIGGVILFDTDFVSANGKETTAEKLAEVRRIINKYNNPAGGIPRFVSTDNEGGGPPATKAERALWKSSKHTAGRPSSVQRLNSLQGFTDMPYAYDMSSPKETEEKTFKMADELSRKEEGANGAGAGITMNFAPVADLCVDGNAIINGIKRCYASGAERVADHVVKSAVAQMSYDIIPSLKHFPGHGASEGDSHQGYAAVNKTYDQLWSEDISVYTNALPRITKADLNQQRQWNEWRVQNKRKPLPLIERNPSIMVGHLNFPNIPELGPKDSQLPASLNPAVVTGWLREKMGFKGLIVTDDIGAMKAITDKYSHLKATKMAIMAGNDQIILTNANGKPFTDADSQEAFLTSICADAPEGSDMLKQIETAYKRILQNKLAYNVMKPEQLDPEMDNLSDAELAAVGVELNSAGEATRMDESPATM